MEHFWNAKVVRLLNHHNKYLTADEDNEDAVRQHRSGVSWRAKWEVELVKGKVDVIRLKSGCFNRYLAASEERFLLGATGRKVVLLPLPANQQPESLGESVEWQPVQYGNKFVKLQTKAGTFLRANGFVKPYGNSVTHDTPQLTVTQDWVLWEVDVVERAHNTTADPLPAAADGVVAASSPYPSGALKPGQIKQQSQASAGFFAGKVFAALSLVNGFHSRKSSSSMSEVSASSCISQEEEGYTPSPRSSAVKSPARPTRLCASSTDRETTSVTATPQTYEDSSSTDSSTPISSPVMSPHRRMPHMVSSRAESSRGGRVVHYYFADDDGGIDDSFEGGSFEFHGSTAQQLVHSVEEEAGLDGFILCRRNVINDKLYKLSLNLPLPPDREPMTVFIVHPMSNVAQYIV